MKYDLVIAHRVCPVLSGTAYGFVDKFLMVKSCAESLMTALPGIKVRLIVILDGCGKEYETLYPGAEIIRMDRVGNQATFAKQVELLSAVNDAPFVYFSEDDYLYKPESFKAMLEFAARSGVDFVTPIDHPDRYDGSVSEPLRAEIRVSDRCHWRECGTTCLTFMTRPETVRKCRRVLMAYANGEQDSVTWLGLTKWGLFSPQVILRSVVALMRRFGGRNVWFGQFIPLMAWWRHNFRLFITRRYRLWSPLPSLAFHLSSNTVPPVFKHDKMWSTFVDNAKGR